MPKLMRIANEDIVNSPKFDSYYFLYRPYKDLTSLHDDISRRRECLANPAWYTQQEFLNIALQMINVTVALQNYDVEVTLKHWQGLCRNNISPENVWLQNNGRGVKLAGFDLIKPIKCYRFPEETEFATKLLRE
jgi:hypothetical protein